mmetsp:Transcript_16898/g.46249  ORF Transcript_16898/g.46249 Transcript_16898/m.46249 type:complete len:121 (-) Transcript_16898:652-1014(-)
MFDLQLAPYFAIGGLSFAVMFTTLTVSPIFLAKPPYSLNASEIGLIYIPIGICMLAGSFFGGTLSDASYARLGKGGRCHDGRLTWLLPGLSVLYSLSSLLHPPSYLSQVPPSPVPPHQLG